MPRDHRKLQVFVTADDLVLKVYRLSRAFPAEERYGLQAQVRRAAVSVATNLVEGCARRSTSDYLRFVDIAYGSAREIAYLLVLSGRLELLEIESANALAAKYDSLQAGLFKLMEALRNRA